ncbi:LysR family transcriptional regulator [Diaphorobacter caeni]|uniref:LysR family transcriptional regulator n=1 Tax=Diaphorobacter caeni TaxID=2784387 RepID=UPI00188E614A|nr:LysR family transcriptional regulator [Diaphorobacter caeni]MBF5007334.1 LysR family transcriptional regulator [Diaphorobacter caeni]
MKKLPDLEAWAVFAKVAEMGSFAKAASELSLSQGTVSKAITRLESRMKANLFHRTSRRISLTDTGMAALERATRILQEGEAIEDEIIDRASTLRGRIRISAPMSFGIARLSPILPAFMKMHPDVELDLHFGDEQTDLIRDRFDLALRISNLMDSSLLARQLCKVQILLVGSPDYFARHGKPAHPRELAGHRGLQYSYARGGNHWRFRHTMQGEFSQTMSTPLQVNNAEALQPALLAGLGLALQPAFLVWKELRDGTLETAMDGWEAESIALHIVTPPGRIRPARVQAFIDYAAQQFMNEPWAELQRDFSASAGA